MKKSLLFSFLGLLLSVLSYGQVDLPVNFENASSGYYGLTDFGGNASAIVVDPADATNHVVKSIKTATAELWAGTTVGGTVGFANKVPFSATATIISVRVYSSSAIGTHVRLKLEQAGVPTVTVETEALTTVVNAWETLLFDFTKQASGTAALNFASTYNLASIFFNFGTTGTASGEQTYYWDDMIFTGTTSSVTGPTTAAPTPTTNAANVISIFSDAYTNVASNLNPGWGQATVVTEESIAGNNTLKYAGLNYQGIELGSNQNVSGMGFLHLDYWTSNSTALNVFVISPGPVEKAYTLTVPTTGWTSVDIPLSAFSPVDLSNVFQFKFDGNGTIYLDNLYFYKQTVSPVEDATLSDLKVDGTTIAGFSASKLTYNVELPIGSTVVPTVTATSNVVGAGVVITPAAGLPGTSNIVVTATNGIATKTYSVAFTIAVAKPDLPITFEDATMNYALNDFGGNASEIVVDPADATNHAVKSIKTAAAELWAGTTVGETIGFANKIPFTLSATKMNVRVYSPAVGIPVRLKVEDKSDPTKSVENEAFTTIASAWETLAFDFSKQATGTAALNLSYNYNKASIFFNFGTTGAVAGEQTYYWDDLKFGDGTPTRIENPKSDNYNVKLYPNPADNELYIRSNLTISKVSVYDVAGTPVKEYGNVESINVSDFKKGVYVIRVTDTNGKSVFSKFIKR